MSGRRLVGTRPRAGAAERARTSDDLAAEPELDLWLSDDLTEESAVGLVVRGELPADPAEAAELIRRLQPRRHEVFGVPYRTAVNALTVLRCDQRSMDQQESGAPTVVRAVVVRGEDIGPLEWRPATGVGEDQRPLIRPGDTIVLDSAVPLFTRSDEASPPVVVPVDRARPVLSGHPASDRLEAEALLPAWPGREIGGVVLRIESPGLAERVQGADSAGGRRDVVKAWLSEVTGPTVMQASALRLLRRPVRDSDVIIQPIAGESCQVLIVDRRRATADEAIRQVWTPRQGGAVTLADHQRDVAERAAELGQSVRLPHDLVETLRMAGAHHDDGKRDERFQRRLRADDTVLLAKSAPDTTVQQSREAYKTSGLPAGWRHEQRSVVDSWEVLSACPDRTLAARLVGTSHGYGRCGFPHSGYDLIGGDARAQQLFDLGDWDELIERTHKRYGLWGCAYLEALLRGADGQVSGEGR